MIISDWKKKKLDLLAGPLIICAIFLTSLISSSVIVPVVGQVFGVCCDVPLMVFASIFSSFITVLVLSLMKYVNWHSAFSWSSQTYVESLCIIVVSFLLLVAMNALSELLDLPDNNAQRVMSMVYSPLGIITLVFVGPVVEELVFREAMIGYVLRKGGKAWWAVLISAVIFGLVHANPAQVPFAVIAGLLFGWIYCKYHSIVLTSILHILNNGMAVFLILLYGEDASIVSFFEKIFGE